MTAGCKVDRVQDEYDLYQLNERIKHRYQQRDHGVRRLETFINQQVLRRAMEKAGMNVIDSEEENYHRLLTNDDVLDSDRRQAKSELRSQGVDVERVQADWVSYRTVHKHLNECLGIDTSKDYTPDIDEDQKRVKKMQSRFTNVVEGTLDRLSREDAAHIEDPTASISIKVRCGKCNRRHDVTDLLESGACPCQSEA